MKWKVSHTHDGPVLTTGRYDYDEDIVEAQTKAEARTLVEKEYPHTFILVIRRVGNEAKCGQTSFEGAGDNQNPSAGAEHVLRKENYRLRQAIRDAGIRINF